MSDAFIDADVPIGLPRKHVPTCFEDYLRQKRAVKIDAATCTCCLKEDQCWRLGDDEGPYCPRCMGYQFGYDQAEESVLRFVFAGIIAGALSAAAPIEDVASALRDALDEQMQREAFAAGQMYGRPGRATR